MHHLAFLDTTPSSVVVKDTVTSPEKVIKLVKEDTWRPTADNLLHIIPPPGLSLERRQSLRKDQRILSSPLPRFSVP